MISGTPLGGNTDSSGFWLFRPTVSRPRPTASSSPPTTSTFGRGPASSEGGPTGQREVHSDHGDQDERDIDPEDALPAERGGERRAVEGAEHAAELLRRADRADDGRPSLVGPQVGDQGHGDRQQSSTGEPLQRPPRDEHVQRRMAEKLDPA